MKKLALIIPTYNERRNMQPLFAALSKVSTRLPRNWRMEIVVVDDNSPDDTAAKIEQIKQAYANRTTGLTAKKIHIYHNPNKQGLGKAYIAGFAYALKNLNVDALGQFDADLSHDPYKIPELLVKLDQGYDMAIGSRYITGGSIPSDWDWYRKLLSRVGNAIVRTGLGHPEVKDWSTGFRIFTKKVYTRIKLTLSDEQCAGYLIMIALVHAALKQNFKVAEVPFAFVDRKYGESKLGVEYIIHTLAYIVQNKVISFYRSLLETFNISTFRWELGK